MNTSITYRKGKVGTRLAKRIYDDLRMLSQNGFPVNRTNVIFERIRLQESSLSTYQCHICAAFPAHRALDCFETEETLYGAFVKAVERLMDQYSKLKAVALSKERVKKMELAS